MSCPAGEHHVDATVWHRASPNVQHLDFEGRAILRDRKKSIIGKCWRRPKATLLAAVSWAQAHTAVLLTAVASLLPPPETAWPRALLGQPAGHRTAVVALGSSQMVSWSTPKGSLYRHATGHNATLREMTSAELATSK